MSRRKGNKFLIDNLVMIVGIPLIIGIHYGWLKLQELPYLVPPSDKKDLPLLEAVKTLNRKYLVGQDKSNDGADKSE